MEENNHSLFQVSKSIHKIQVPCQKVFEFHFQFPSSVLSSNHYSMNSNTEKLWQKAQSHCPSNPLQQGSSKETLQYLQYFLYIYIFQLNSKLLECVFFLKGSYHSTCFHYNIQKIPRCLMITYCHFHHSQNALIYSYLFSISV